MDGDVKYSSICVNCRSQLEYESASVAHISVTFQSDGEEEEQRKELSILEALSAVFVSSRSELLKVKAADGGTLFMCFRCAEGLSGLYQAYVQFLTFSDPEAQISRLIRQVELWHQHQGEGPSAEDNLLSVKEEMEYEEENDSDDPFPVLATTVFSSVRNEPTTPLSEHNDPDDFLGRRRSSRMAVRKKVRFGSSTEDMPEVKANENRASRTPTRLTADRLAESPEQIPETTSDYDDSENEDANSEDDYSPSTDNRQRPRRAVAERMANNVSEVMYKPKGAVKRKKYKERHRDPSKPRRLIPCTEPGCKRRFLSTSRIEQHVLGDHRKGEPAHSCAVCDFQCFDAETLSSHFCITKEEQESENLRFRCNRCGKAYPTVRARSQHQGWHDFGSTDIYKCQVEGCTMEYRSRTRFQLHLRKVHGGGTEPAKRPEKVQCQICGNFFIHIKIHMLSHSEEKKFLCTECGKSFSRSCYLTEHMRSHSSDRNYQCQLCRVCFKKPHNLSRHYKSSAHADQPNLVSELVKHVVKHKLDGGPVLLPRRVQAMAENRNRNKDRMNKTSEKRHKNPTLIQGQSENSAEESGEDESSSATHYHRLEIQPGFGDPAVTGPVHFVQHPAFPPRHRPQMQLYGYPDY